MGWPRDYAMVRAIDRLRAPPLTAHDYEGFVDPARTGGGERRRSRRSRSAASSSRARICPTSGPRRPATSPRTPRSCSTCCSRGCGATRPRSPRPSPRASMESRSAAWSRCASGSRAPTCSGRSAASSRRSGGPERASGRRWPRPPALAGPGTEAAASDEPRRLLPRRHRRASRRRGAPPGSPTTSPTSPARTTTSSTAGPGSIELLLWHDRALAQSVKRCAGASIGRDHDCFRGAPLGAHGASRGADGTWIELRPAGARRRARVRSRGDLLPLGFAAHSDFGRGLRAVARKDRARATIAIQTYARAAWAMPGSVDSALRALGTDYVDILGLAWWNAPPPARIVDRALALQETGKVRAPDGVLPRATDVRRPRRRRPLRRSHGPVQRRAPRPRARGVPPRLRRFEWRAAAVPESSPSPRRAGARSSTPPTRPTGERAPSAGDCYRFALSTRRSTCACRVRATQPSSTRPSRQSSAARSTEDEMAWMRASGRSVRSGTQASAPGWRHGARSTASPRGAARARVANRLPSAAT